MLRKVLCHPAAVDPEQQVQPFVDTGRIDVAVERGHRIRLEQRQLFVRQLGRIIEYVVVEHVISDGEQVHPIARFGNLHQPALVHILVVEPEHGAVDHRPVGAQKLQIAGQMIVEKVPQDKPEV